MGRVTLLIACVGAVLAAPTGAQGESTPEQGLQSLNAWRAEIGLAPVTEVDPHMSEGCRLHNRYSALNNVLEHNEQSDAPGYSLLGFAAAQSSVLGGEGPGPREVWGHTLYHRIQLQHPRLTRTWWSSSDGFACMGTVGGFGLEDVGGSVTVPTVLDTTTEPPPTLIAFPDPPPGAEGVPPLGPTGETPDPRSLVPGTPELIGWIPTAVFDGPWYPGTEFEPIVGFAAMAPDGGAAIAISTETDEYPFAVAIVPHRPLEPLTWYSARAVGVLREIDIPPDELHFDVSWRFRTGDEQVREVSDIRICAGQTVTLPGGPGRDVLRGTPGRDVIAGYGGADVVRGLGGRDRICGGSGRDRIIGGPGADVLRGQRGADRLYGGGGGDHLAGEGGRDILFGGRGSDRLGGGRGRDLIVGGPGADRPDGRRLG